MQTVFTDGAGYPQFIRDDMEQGNWSVQDYTVNATFPYVAGKIIRNGMRMVFRAYGTNTMQAFEVRNATTVEPEHYQQIVCEHIAIGELSSDHINTTDIENKTVVQALTTVLTGTLWAVGANTAGDATQTVNISRGSVWQAVGAIAQNWNVYITPRTVTNAAGMITARYLDIAPAAGTWHGVRLSLDKNISDASVAIDDSEVITAMYGYGGLKDVPQQTTPDTREEVTFTDVVWQATAEHPAKPAGQAYIEDPTKTALYGRNGRPRFGFYQNGDIKDANVLLEKTWETLKTAYDPKISITGTVSDLHRLGYADEPLYLHDLVAVEIRPTGEQYYLQVIRLDVDLIDPTATRPEIGAYVPNIVYINKETQQKATGGGGGGGRGQSNAEIKEYNTFYDINARTDEYGSMIALVVGKKNGASYIKTGEICIAINQDNSTEARILADHVYMGSTTTGQPINVVIDGKLDATELNAQRIASIIATISDLTVGGTLRAQSIYLGTGAVPTGNLGNAIYSIRFNNGYLQYRTFTASGYTDIVNLADQYPLLGAVSDSFTYRHCTLGTAHWFIYSANSEATPTYTTNGRLVTSYSDTTIYYLKPPT